MPSSARRVPARLAKAAAGVLIGLVLAELLLQAAGLVLSHRWERWGAGTEGEVLLCVGDSHTFGLGVLAPQSYPNRLHAILNGGRRPERYRVVSRGVPGRNSAVVRQKLPLYLRRFHPRVVLILAGYNNAWNSDGSWVWREDEGDAWSARLEGWLSRLKLVKLVRLAWFNLRGGTGHDDTFRITSDGRRFFVEEEGERRPIHPGTGSAPGLRAGAELSRVTRLDLEACVRIARSAGARPVLMTYALRGGAFDAVNAAARAAARETGALLVDLARNFAPLMEKDRAAWVLPDGTHLNAAGHDRAARIVAEALAAAGLVERPTGSVPECKAGRETPHLGLGLRILGGQGEGTPRIEVRGRKGAAFQVILAERKSGEGRPGVPGVPGLAMDGLVTLSCTIPSFRGTFGGEPQELAVPSKILEQYAGRTIYCCLVALDEHAPDPAQAVLAVTPPAAIRVP